MGYCPDQITSFDKRMGVSPAAKKQAKKALTRIRRRLWRQMGEDAPTRRLTKGYVW